MSSDHQHSADRARLIEIIRKRSYGTGVVIKLASGRTSDFYFGIMQQAHLGVGSRA